jgi:single-strand DNA-binding protein
MKKTSSGNAMVTFPLAVQRKWKTSDGETKKDTGFYRIVFWNSTADAVAKYLSKGKPVLVEGRLEIRNFTDSKGNVKYITQIVGDQISFLDQKRQSSKQLDPSDQPSIM